MMAIKVLVGLAVLMLIGPIGFASAQNCSKAKGPSSFNLCRAEAWVRSGKFKKALAEVRSLIAIRYEVQKSYEISGDSNAGMGLPEAALTDYREVLKQSIYNQDVFDKLATILVEQGRLLELDRDATRFLVNFPRSHRALYHRGWARYARGELRLALQDFDQGLAGYASGANYQAELLQCRALTRAMLGRFQPAFDDDLLATRLTKASKDKRPNSHCSLFSTVNQFLQAWQDVKTETLVSAVQRIAEMNKPKPRHADMRLARIAWLKLQLTLVPKSRNHKRVISIANELEQLGESSRDMFKYRAAAHKALGHSVLAQQDFREWLKLEPDSDQALGGLAESLFAARSYRELSETTERLLKKNPRRTKALQLQGWSLYKENYLTKAQAAYARLLQLEPMNADAWNENAVVLQGQEKYAEALASYDKAVAIDPLRATFRRNRASLQVARSHYQEALQDYLFVAAKEPSANDLASAAEMLIELGRAGEAEPHLVKAMQQAKVSAYAFYVNGRFKQFKGNILAAEVYYKTALRLDPDYHMARYHIAELRYDAGKYKEAFDAFSGLTRIWPTNARLQTDIGMTLYNQGQFEAAIEYFSRATIHDPNDSLGFERRAFALVRLGRFAEAETDATAAISKNKDDAMAYAHRAYARWKLDRMMDAQADYDRAVELKPKLGWLRQERAEFHYAKSEFDKTMADAKAVIAMGNVSAETYRYYGLATEAKGNYSEALEYYNRALTAKYSDYWHVEDRAFAYLGLNRPLEALAECNLAIKLKPDAASPYRCRARASSVMRNYVGAERDLDEAIKHDSGFMVAYYDRGFVHMDLQKWEQAEADFTKTVNSKYRLVDSLYYRGLAREELQRWHSAAEDYRACLAIADHVWAKAASARLNRLQARRFGKTTPRTLDDSLSRNRPSLLGQGRIPELRESVH